MMPTHSPLQFSFRCPWLMRALAFVSSAASGVLLSTVFGAGIRGMRRCTSCLPSHNINVNRKLWSLNPKQNNNLRHRGELMFTIHTRMDDTRSCTGTRKPRRITRACLRRRSGSTPVIICLRSGWLRIRPRRTIAKALLTRKQNSN